MKETTNVIIRHPKDEKGCISGIIIIPNGVKLGYYELPKQNDEKLLKKVFIYKKANNFVTYVKTALNEHSTAYTILTGLACFRLILNEELEIAEFDSMMLNGSFYNPYSHIVLRDSMNEIMKKPFASTGYESIEDFFILNICEYLVGQQGNYPNSVSHFIEKKTRQLENS